jgi:hypothetical protein
MAKAVAAVEVPAAHARRIDGLASTLAGIAGRLRG